MLGSLTKRLAIPALMRVLVVEDYTPLRAALVQALRDSGYTVDQASEGVSGLQRAREGDYDVILLDLMLPGVDGLQILAELRREGSTSQVLVLTARDQVPDRVRGLDLGADDYMVKPFAMQELLARVRVLVRRRYDRPAAELRVGHVTIDTNDHSVRVEGEPVELTAREYALLEYLAHRKGQVVSRAEIFEHVYDEPPSAASNVVDVYVGYLRRKLERPGLPKLLHTRRGEGYILREGEAG